jgi:hypothetical protein
MAVDFMTSAELLSTLRARGYRVRLQGAELDVSGPAPRDPEAAARLLREHHADLVGLLQVEDAIRHHPAVQEALGIFPASRLVAFRSPDGERWTS